MAKSNTVFQKRSKNTGNKVGTVPLPSEPFKCVQNYVSSCNVHVSPAYHGFSRLSNNSIWRKSK